MASLLIKIVEGVILQAVIVANTLSSSRPQPSLLTFDLHTLLLIDQFYFKASKITTIKSLRDK